MTTEVQRARRALLPAIEGGFFCDSHGALWVSCEADDRGAVAFGPTGVARLVLRGAYAVLADAGLVEDDDDDGVPVVPAASIARAVRVFAAGIDPGVLEDYFELADHPVALMDAFRRLSAGEGCLSASTVAELLEVLGREYAQADQLDAAIAEAVSDSASWHFNPEFWGEMP